MAPVRKSLLFFHPKGGLGLMAIVVGCALCASPVSRLPESSAVEAPVAKSPEGPPKDQEVPKPSGKPKPADGAPTQRTFTNSIGMTFVLIPAGSFTMGSPTSEPGRHDNERQYPVTISKPFFLQNTEVTQKQWREVMGKHRGYHTGCDDCPVEDVSWEDAQIFINTLSGMEHHKYRLPTEAEWEYACRATSKDRFCFGDEEAKLGEYGWYYENSGEKTHPVGQKKPNAWALCDMHGNVYEWCQDWYGDYPTSQVTDPTGPKYGHDFPGRVVRGGSYSDKASLLRCAYRGREMPGDRWFDLGFRLARDF